MTQAARRVVLLPMAALVFLVLPGCLRQSWEQRFEGATVIAELFPTPPREIEIVAVGDVMLDRTVGRRIEAHGARSILQNVRELLREGDLTFCNLECPLAHRGPHDAANCLFRADPATAAVLADGGFDVVSLANNHALDAGRAGVLETLNTLEARSIEYVGCARDRERSSEPVVLCARGLRVGFMAFCDLDFAASYSRVGHDLKALAAKIEAARRNCDLLCVSYHWGEEYRERPTRRQRELAHATINAGADVVLGHHPHVLQGIEAYRGGVILYSMGNFVFDQRAGERMESGIFALKYAEGRGWEVTVTPLWIPLRTTAPQEPEPGRARSILTRLKHLSAELGTSVAIEAGRAVVRAGAREPSPVLAAGST